MTDTDTVAPGVTVRVPPLQGMHPGTQGTAGIGQPGANVTVVAPAVWEYILLDILLYSYVMGFITASAFATAGQFEQHGSGHDVVGALTDIALKAFIPGAVLAAKDLSVWLYKRRQAHGLA